MAGKTCILLYNIMRPVTRRLRGMARNRRDEEESICIPLCINTTRRVRRRWSGTAAEAIFPENNTMTGTRDLRRSAGGCCTMDRWNRSAASVAAAFIQEHSTISPSPPSLFDYHGWHNGVYIFKCVRDHKLLASEFRENTPARKFMKIKTFPLINFFRKYFTLVSEGYRSYNCFFPTPNV